MIAQIISSTNDWYRIKNEDEIDSPALVVYLERVKENIRLLKSMIHDVKRLRPHVKTHKTREICLLLMEAGIQKFKCATIAEAEMLGMCGAPDVLLAYQPVGPKIKRFISLIQQYPSTNYSCLIDNFSNAESIAYLASQALLEIPVFIDLNAGMNRTGMAPGEEAIYLYEQSAQLNGLQPVGFHFYDGHIKNPDLQKRTEECNSAFTVVDNMKEQLIQKGYEEPVIVAGGTPTFLIHAQRKDVECSPGTFIFWDAGYQKAYPEQPFLPAALVMTRIISLPGPTKICLDLGHKSIASENELHHRVAFLNASALLPVGHSEEHLVVDAPVHHAYKVGDVIYALPVHICPTCALYERALIVENGRVTNDWKIIARDRVINV